MGRFLAALLDRRTGQHTKPQPSLCFETLEPRLLLSAQVLHVDPSHLGGDWAVQIDAATHSVQILDQQRGDAVVQQYSVPANSSVEIDVSQNDHLVVDVASLPATAGASAPNLNWVELSGQAGDTLAASGRSDQWAINGQGNGTLDGLQFVGFTKLEDASGSNDTFVWQPNGPVLMAIVGVGSGDSASIQGNGFQTVGVTTSGPQSGSVAIDGSTLDFAGLGGISIDPLKAEQEVVANVTVTAPAAKDDLVLKTAANDAKLTFESLKNTSPSVTFYKPSESLTVDATGGDDTVSVNPLSLNGASLTLNLTTVTASRGVSNTVNLDSISTGGGALTVNNAPSEPLLTAFSLDDEITVNSGATISTRDLDAAGAVIGDSGAITLNGTEIDLGANSSLNASGDGAFKAGDVTLAANYQVIATGFVIDPFTNTLVPPTASVTVGAGAAIDGGTVDVGATAGDQTLSGSVVPEPGGFDLIKPLQNFTSFLNLPVSVLVKSSEADVTIGEDATLNASDALTVDATDQSLATGNAIYWISAGVLNKGGVAVVYDETDATANITIAQDASLTAGGDVSVISSAASKATGVARVAQNTGAFPTNPQNVQVSVAVGYANLVSHVNVAKGAEIISGGNVAVRALGVSGDSQSSETASYNDGLVGVDGTLVFTDNDVKATVDGTIIAQGSRVPPSFTFNPFGAVDPSTGQFSIGNATGVQTGDAFTYSSGLGGAIGGLTDGQVYYAIRIPGNSASIQLAATQADAMAGKAIQLQPNPTITTVQGGQSFQFANVDEGPNALELGQDASSLNGKDVVYHAVAGQQVGGLVDGKTYLAQAVAGNPQEIQLVDPVTHGAPVLDINPTVTTANGQSFNFSVDETPDDLVLTAPPGFVAGQALVYHQALGLQIDGLVDGQTYYAIPVPNGDGSAGSDPDRFRLAATEADAISSDGYTNVVDISTDDSTYESGDAHTLTPIAQKGIVVSATLSTSDKAATKSGIGSEPKARDVISKSEFAPGFTNVLANLQNIVTPGTSNPIESKIKSNIPEGSGSNTNFALSAGVAFLTANNNVMAEIGGDALLQSGANVSVTATISHKMQAVAEGSISKSGNSQSTFAVGGAADIAIDTDSAQALVDSGAQIDAASKVSVTSDVEFPFLTPIGSPDQYGQALLNNLQSNPLGLISSFVGRTLFVQDQLVNSWTRSVGKNPKGGFTVAGAVDFEDFNTTSNAIISGGALINQNAALQNSAQSVSVNAETNLNRVDVTGVFDIEFSPDGLAKARRAGDATAIYQPFGTQAKTGALGGAFNIIDYNTTTTAEIGGGARVDAGASGSLSVDASQDILAVELLQSGAKGGTFGVSGGLDFVTDTSNTQAFIGSGATISAPSIDIDASDQTILFSLVGDVANGGSLGFGVSATISDVTRTTLAYIGDPNGTSMAASSIGLGSGTLSIEATTKGGFYALSAAAAIVGDDSKPSGGQTNLTTPNAGQGDPGVSTGSFGLAVSGAVSVTSADETTEAFINDAGVITAGSIELAALNNTLLVNGAGSAAIANGQDGSTNVGLAGAYSEVDLSGKTQAYVARATLNVSGDLNVSANRTGQAVSLAGGGSGDARYSGVALAGSVAVNRMSQDTSTAVDHATIHAGGNVTLASADALALSVVAGALSFGGKFGFGSAVAYNFVNSSVRTRIIDSTVTLNGALFVDASRGEAVAASDDSPPQIVAVAGSISLNAARFGAAGTAAANFIAPSSSGAGVEASITGSSVTNSGANSVSVEADGDQGIVVVAGGVTAGKQTGFGVAVAYNEITAPVRSFIQGGAVDSTGGVDINANDQSNISSGALGAVLAGQNAAAAGSASANTISQPIEASIKGGANVTSGGPAMVRATETSVINGVAGSAAFAPKSTAFGAAIVTNTVANRTSASVDSSIVVFAGAPSSRALTVEALSEGDQISAVAAGGEGADKFAGGGSVAVNTIRNTSTAGINRNTDATFNANEVTIHAGESADTYTASAGNGAGAKSAAIGAAVATNDVASSIQATVVGGSSPTLGGTSKVTVAADRVGDKTIALAVGGAGAETFALGGSVATNKDRSQLKALVEGSIGSAESPGDLTISAEDVGNLQSLTAGSGAGAKSAAIGAAVSLADLAPTIEARVANGVRLVARQVNIEASSTKDQTVIVAVGGAGAQTFAGGGSSATDKSHAVVEASIDQGANLTTDNAYVTAAETSDLVSTSAGEFAGAQSAAIGAAVVVDNLADDVVAQVTGGSSVSGANSVTISAETTDNQVLGIAVGGTGAGTFAAGGSVVTNTLGGTTDATVGGATTLNASGGITIEAVDQGLSVSAGAGGVAGAKDAAIGAAVATDIDQRREAAQVDQARVMARELAVDAHSDETINTVAVGGAGAGTFALGGSVAVTKLAGSQDARADDGAVIVVGDVAFGSSRADNVRTIGGAIAGAGKASVGVGNATLIGDDSTTAEIGNAQITATGGGAGFNVPMGVDGSLGQFTDFHGLSVTAVADDDLLTAALGGAGSGSAAVAGSASLTILDETTTATLGAAASLDPTDVNVLAANTTDLIGAGGGLAGGSSVGFGAGVDTAKITKDTEASITASFHARGTIFDEALSSENVVSAAGAGGFSGSVGIAGSGSVQVYDLRTIARIGNDAAPSTVSAQGSVLIAANDQTELNQFAGGLGGGDGFAAGASAAVSTITKTTMAYVGAGSTVTALGLGPVMAPTGGFTVTYAPPPGNTDQVQPPKVSINLTQQTKDSAAGSVNNPGLTGEWVGAANYSAMGGVAVTATNQDDVQSFTFAAGGATAAISVAGAVNVTNATTKAYIGAGATVNANPTGAASNDSVRVIAASNYHRLGITGAGAISGAFDATPAADVTIVSEDTEALVSGTIQAKQDLTVNAGASENILAIAAGLGASGVATLDAGAAVVKIADQTIARFNPGSTVYAGGNVLLSATDNSTVLNVVGIGALGGLSGAGGGVGASAGIVIIDKTTQAEIASGAVVDALANGPNNLAYPVGNSTSTPFETASLKGLAVLAQSNENVTNVAVAGAGGFYVGVAGGVTVTLVSSNTNALVDSGASVNLAGGANSSQSVAIVAADSVKTLTVGGAFGAGLVGIGGGIDVGVIRNNVTTTVSGDVRARNTIEVLGISNENVKSYSISGAAGAVGVAGAVSVWTLGTGFDPTYSDTSKSTNALIIKQPSQYSSFITYADAQMNRKDILGLLGNYKNDGKGTDNTTSINAIVGEAASDYASEQPKNAMLDAEQNKSVSGLRVVVGSGANLQAGGSIRVNAAETVNANLTVGGGGVGLVGVGGSVGILHAGRLVEASLDGRADAGGAVSILADTLSNVHTGSFGGGAGLAGIGAEVAIMTDTGQVVATVNDTAAISRASSVTVRASRTYGTFTAEAKGGAIGAAAAGASVARATIGGFDRAAVDGATIGALTGSNVGNLTVSASLAANPVADTIAAAAGIGAGAGNVSNSTVNPLVRATVTGGLVGITGDLTIGATSNATASSTGLGKVIGGVTVGVSQADASNGIQTVASINGASSGLRAHNVSVSATSSTQALADSTADAGISLIGGTGALASATMTTQTQAFVQNVSNFVAAGNVTISANNSLDKATAGAKGVNAPGLAVGVSKASVTMTPIVYAYLVQGSYTIGGSLQINATHGGSGDQSSATGYGSVGGVPLGTNLTANISLEIDPKVRAVIGSPDSPDASSSTAVNATDNVEVHSFSKSNGLADADNSGNGIFGAQGEAHATLTISQLSQVWAGADVSVTAGKDLILAASTVENTEARANGAGGSFVPTGEAFATSTVKRSAEVFVGPRATLHADAVGIGADDAPTTQGNAAYESKGFGGKAVAKADTTLGFPDWATSGVRFEGGSSVTARTINVNANTNYNLSNDSYADYQGLGGEATGRSQIDVGDWALILFDGNNTLRGTQSVTLRASFISQGVKTHVHTYLGAATGTNNLDSIINLLGGVVVQKGPAVTVTTPNFVHSATSNIGTPSATGEREGTFLSGGDNRKEVNNKFGVTDQFR